MENEQPKKIGLFGGTFDPIHQGHLIIAEEVRRQAGLDMVLFIPSARPPHKHYDLMFTSRERYDMIDKAIENNPFFRVSDIEMKRDVPSFTIDTLREIKTQVSGGTDLYFIVGKDNLYDIQLWKDPRSIVKECTVLVADRLCERTDAIPPWLEEKVQLVHMPIIDISSTEIRRRISANESIRYIVPEGVVGMIAQLHESRKQGKSL